MNILIQRLSYDDEWGGMTSRLDDIGKGLLLWF